MYFCSMILMMLSPRTTTTTDWATALFVICFILIALTRTAFEKRFNDYARLIVSDKYIKVYKDSSHLTSPFNVLLFIVQILVLAFFIQIVLSYFDYVEKNDYIVYIRIFTLTTVFILAKFLIDKIIGVTFNIEEFIDQFNLRKVSYRNYLAIVLLPVDIILFYNNFEVKSAVIILIITIITINVITYLLSLKNYQNFVAGKLFYFILYLCALEIAPYYFMYYWFTRFSTLES